MADEPSNTDDHGKNLTWSITIGSDGRLYFHDLPVDLLPVACEMCPDDRTLKARLQALGAMKKGTS